MILLSHDAQNGEGLGSKEEGRQEDWGEKRKKERQRWREGPLEADKRLMHHSKISFQILEDEAKERSVSPWPKMKP